MTPPLHDIFTVGTCRIVASLNQIHRDNQCLVVEPKVMEVLVYLASRQGEVCSKQQLMDAIWPAPVSDGAVSRVITLLRKALADSTDSPRYIQTIAKKGYQFIAVVEVSMSEPMHINKFGSPTSPAIRHAHQLFIPFVACTLLILLVLVVTHLIPSPPTDQATTFTKPPSFQKLTSESGREYDAQLSADASWLVYRHKNNQEQPYQLYLKQLQTNRTIQLTDNGFDHRSPALSHDKQSIAYFQKGQNQCALRRLTLLPNGEPDTIHTLHLCGALEHYSHVVWSPDDKWLYFTDRANSSVPYQIYRLELATNRLETMTSRENNFYGDNELALSPSGRSLLFFRNKYWGNNQVYVMDLTTNALKKIGELGFLSWKPSWSPDEKSIVFSDNRNGGKLNRLDISTGQITTFYQSPKAIQYPMFSADGKRVVFSEESIVANLWETKLTALHENSVEITVTPKKLALSSSGVERQPAYSPDGRKLAFLSDRNGEIQLWIADDEQLVAAPMLPKGAIIDSFSWSPDNQQLVIATKDKALLRYQLTTQTIDELLHEQSAAFPIYAHDGLKLYFSSDKSGQWEIWSFNLQNGETHQVTTSGGYQVKLAADDTTMYITKYDQTGIWQYDLKTGVENEIIADLARTTQYTLCDNTLYYEKQVMTGDVWQYSVIDSDTQLAFTLPRKTQISFDVTPNCQKMAFAYQEDLQADIVELSWNE
ncbi:winged helix-turn-helix domain-containing protein [Pseudoalteromonas xiamenensis]|uniref:winged helix-turn-helix domain-containing protein n=1 Tax=Pseudoalteromonas xiamenensis TaxID=882626 RepID=UPI0035E57DDA